MMRISTNIMYDLSVATMHRQQAEFMHVGEQIASGRRVVRPSDDPQAASRAVVVSQSKAATEQYLDARVSARNALSQEESVLASVAQAIQSAKTLAIQAASGTLADADRESVASEMNGVLEAVLAQANATDGNGTYLFGGYRDNSPPFVRNAGGSIDYVGDTNVRQERVDASRYMNVADNGETIFRMAHSSAGYLARANDGNTGSVVFTGPRVVDPADPDYGSSFTVEFSVVGPDTFYSINGGPDQAYESDSPITFGGLSLTLKGEPDDGDQIQVAPAQQMTPDLFATFERAIGVLQSPAQTDAERARLQNTMSAVMREFDNALDNVLTVRASVGARLNELDTMDDVGEQRILNYTQSLSDLVDLDYVDAISEYIRRQIGLQAAQKTFANISGLSLFDQM